MKFTWFLAILLTIILTACGGQATQQDAESAAVEDASADTAVSDTASQPEATPTSTKVRR
ncbi:MAG: hypothetical protein B6243_14010 [Anaerolineaceae bacterium 4572_5.2]|nr:MAG: hypothetical protein B6243_14010 [Anaerolineaceae bacterium 4572_5.2]